MKVFIWGCYNQGNFGDDLMGIVFAKLFLKEGCDVKVYKLSEKLAIKYDIGTVGNLKDGVQWCDLLIIGGGAFIKRECDTHPSINAEIKELYNNIVLFKKNVYALSIGSDNISTLEDIYEYRKSIIFHENFLGGTVRLAKDLIIFERNNNVEYIPDVVLTLPEMFKYLGLGEKDTCLNLKNKNVYNFSKKNFIKYLISGCLDISIPVFFKSHNPEFGIKSEVSLPFMPSYTNVDPIETSFELSKAKKVISSKLHVGIAACSFGVPFKSLFGNSKTNDFLAQHDKDLHLNEDGVFLSNLNWQKNILERYLCFIKKIIRDNY